MFMHQLAMLGVNLGGGQCHLGRQQGIVPVCHIGSGGTRSYSWVKSRLQEGGLVVKAPGRGKHRKRRERAAWLGMLLHQDGSTHERVPGCQWDLS